jgi:3-methyladenine DNA glycosylase AlkC
MAEQLKNMFFTRESVDKMAEAVKRFYPGFDKQRFIDLIFDDAQEERELTEKMRHTSRCLHQTLPESFPEALEILKQIAPLIKGFDALTLPDFVARYGLDNWQLSLPALRYFTKYSTSELAIRPFLARDPDRAMPYMREWADDEDYNVRRLASEGCRPKLPWAMALPAFQKDPRPILPILEKLKGDESGTVRRSVANNLNDISKDHPDMVLDICEKWYGQSKQTDEIAKHACRTLLKKGNRRALLLFGCGDPAGLSVEAFKLGTDKLPIGEDLHYSFELVIGGNESRQVRLEYAVYYVKAKNKMSKKVFKLSENTFKPGRHAFSRKQSFQDMSTRKHYPGQHRLTIIVNGEEKAAASFYLLNRS